VGEDHNCLKILISYDGKVKHKLATPSFKHKQTCCVSIKISHEDFLSWDVHCTKKYAVPDIHCTKKYAVPGYAISKMPRLGLFCLSLIILLSHLRKGIVKLEHMNKEKEENTVSLLEEGASTVSRK
jgi:hypothetical protein